MYTNIKAMKIELFSPVTREYFTLDQSYLLFVDTLERSGLKEHQSILKVAQFVQGRIASSEHYKNGSWKEAYYSGYEFFAARLILLWADKFMIGPAAIETLIYTCLLGNVPRSEFPIHVLPKQQIARISELLQKNRTINELQFNVNGALQHFNEHVNNYTNFVIEQAFSLEDPQDHKNILLIRMVHNYTYLLFMTDAVPEQQRSFILFLSEYVYGRIAIILGVTSIAEEFLDLAFKKSDPKNFTRTKILIETKALGGQEYTHASQAMRTFIKELEDDLNSPDIRERYGINSTLFPDIQVQGNLKKIYSVFKKYSTGKGEPDTVLPDIRRIRIIVDNASVRRQIATYLIKERWPDSGIELQDHTQNNTHHKAWHYIFIDENNLRLEVQLQTREELQKDRPHSLYKASQYFPGWLDYDSLLRIRSQQDILNAIHHKAAQNVYVCARRNGEDILHALPKNSSIFDIACHVGLGDTVLSAIIKDLGGMTREISLDTVLENGWTIESFITKSFKKKVPMINDWLKFGERIRTTEAMVMFLKRFGFITDEKSSYRYKALLKEGKSIFNELLSSLPKKRKIIKYVAEQYFHFNDIDNFYVAISKCLIPTSFLHSAIDSSMVDPKMILPEINAGSLKINVPNLDDIQIITEIFLRNGLSIDEYKQEGGTEGYDIIIESIRDQETNTVQESIAASILDELRASGVHYHLEHKHTSHKQYPFCVDVFFQFSEDHIGQMHDIIGKLMKFRQQNRGIRDISVHSSKFHDQVIDKNTIVIRLGLQDSYFASFDQTIRLELKRNINIFFANTTKGCCAIECTFLRFDPLWKGYIEVPLIDD